MTKQCVMCSKSFETKRPDKLYCSNTCRKRASRGITPSVSAPTAVAEKVVPSPPLKKISTAQAALKERGLPAMLGSDIPDVEYLPTGFADLDKEIGFPRGRFTEIYGKTSAGKSTLAMQCIAGLSQKGKVLFVDAENSWEPIRAAELGIDLDNVVVKRLPVLENAATFINQNIGEFDAVVIDSIAQMSTRVEMENEIGSANIASKARLMGQWLRILNALMPEKNPPAVIFLNQERTTMDMYGPKKFTPGGLALDYAASLRIELTFNKGDYIKDKETGLTIGQKVRAIITKTKLTGNGRPQQEISFKLMY